MVERRGSKQGLGGHRRDLEMRRILSRVEGKPLAGGGVTAMVSAEWC